MLKYQDITKKNNGSNFIKQYSETVMVRNMKMSIEVVASFIINFGTLSLPISYCQLLCEEIFKHSRTAFWCYQLKTGGFQEWPLVQWPTRPLPYGSRRPLMKINKKNLHYSCQNRIFTPSYSVRKRVSEVGLWKLEPT